MIGSRPTSITMGSSGIMLPPRSTSLLFVTSKTRLILSVLRCKIMLWSRAEQRSRSMLRPIRMTGALLAHHRFDVSHRLVNASKGRQDFVLLIARFWQFESSRVNHPRQGHWYRGERNVRPMRWKPPAVRSWAIQLMLPDFSLVRIGPVLRNAILMLTFCFVLFFALLVTIAVFRITFIRTGARRNLGRLGNESFIDRASVCRARRTLPHCNGEPQQCRSGRWSNGVKRNLESHVIGLGFWEIGTNNRYMAR